MRQRVMKYKNSIRRAKEAINLKKLLKKKKIPEEKNSSKTTKRGN